MTSSLVAEVANAIGIEPATLTALLPADAWRVDDRDRSDLDVGFAWIAAGSPIAVLIGRNPEEVVVAVPVVTWRGQTPIVGTVREVRHPVNQDIEQWLTHELAKAKGQRESTYMRCPRCETRVPPEWMLDDDERCQSCAEADGVDF